MYLIDTTYFQSKPYSIPNIGEMQSDAALVLNSIIEEKVREVLIGALGHAEFALLDAQITDGVLNAGADQKWKDLVNGVTYDGKKWNGLIYTQGGRVKSLLVPYVFHAYMSEDTPDYTGIGAAIQQGKNSTIVSNVPTLVKAWNNFLEMYQGYSTGMLPKVQTNGGLMYVDFLNNSYTDNNVITLLRYLSDHNDIYNGTSKRHYPMANRYDL